VASIAAASLGTAGAAQADSYSFGPGPLGSGTVAPTSGTGQGGFTEQSVAADYWVPNSVNSCSYCPFGGGHVQASLGESPQGTITNASVSGYSFTPSTHWFDLQWSDTSGPSGGIG
jgi:hypothetical protein